MNTPFDILGGKTFSSIVNADNEELIFTATTGEKYIFGHRQSCCESVGIVDICGDLNDLVGTPLLCAEERTQYDSNEGIAPEDIPKYQDCFMWTFYEFRTIKGSVTVRWHGDSNGYYSVSVDFWETK